MEKIHNKNKEPDIDRWLDRLYKISVIVASITAVVGFVKNFLQ